MWSAFDIISATPKSYGEITLLYGARSPRGMLFRSFHVCIDGDKLEADAVGEPIDFERHEVAAEAKGATYTELRVAQDADGTWVAQCVVDV